VSPLVATYDYQQQIGTIWTVPPDGSSPPRKRADITGASAAPSIATDACGRLAVLAPTGMFSSSNPISTGLTFQLLDAAGNETSAIALPVKHDYIEDWDMVAVDGGFVITWIEGNQSGAPSRELELAYVTVR
jgi:hypothetical protein